MTMSPEQSKQVVIYFTNGRMVMLPEDKIRYVHLGSSRVLDKEYKPDISGGQAVVNWDNVCFVREWMEQEEFDL